MFGLHNSKIYTFYITFLLVLTSGTALGGKLYYLPFLILLIVSSFLLIKDKLSKGKVVLITFVLAALFSNYFLTGNQDFSAYITLSLKIISVFLIFNAVKFEWVKRNFIIIMAVISAISLPFFLFGLLNPDFIRNTIPLTEIWGGERRVTPLYIYLDWYMDRNSGIYTEPGMFQIFINLAVLLLFKSNFNKKTNRFLHLLFFITMITTFSTSGYLIYSLILLSQYKSWIKMSAPKLVLTTFLLIIIVYIEETTIGAIGNKFNPQSHTYEGSFLRRLQDTFVGLQLLADKPLFGWGLGNSERYLGTQISSSSNGLTSMMGEFGVFYIASYLAYYIFLLKKATKGLLPFTFLFLALMVAINTQGILMFPIFIAPFFIHNEKMGRRYATLHTKQAHA